MAKTTKIDSLSTPGHKMAARSWLAEFVIWRANKGRIPPYFWRDTKWKWKYTNEVKAATKFIKKYGEATVIRVVCENKKLTTLSSYGELEFLLQMEEDKLKRLSMPKDTSLPFFNRQPTIKDLRDPRVSEIKKGLCEKLNEYEKI